jgi:hypothetical protein
MRSFLRLRTQQYMKRVTGPMWMLLPAVLCFLSAQIVSAEDEVPKLIRLKAVEVEEGSISDSLSVAVTHEDISTRAGTRCAPGGFSSSRKGNG